MGLTMSPEPPKPAGGDAAGLELLLLLPEGDLLLDRLRSRSASRSKLLLCNLWTAATCAAKPEAALLMLRSVGLRVRLSLNLLDSPLLFVEAAEVGDRDLEAAAPTIESMEKPSLDLDTLETFTLLEFVEFAAAAAAAAECKWFSTDIMVILFSFVNGLNLEQD